MKFKRAAAIFLTICLCLNVLCIGAFAATTELYMKVPEKIPQPGEKFSVSVDISGNPGVNAVQFAITYNEEVVKCTDVRIGPAISSMMSAENKRADMNGEISAMISAASIDAAKSDGNISNYEFEVISEGDAGLELKNLILTDENGKSVSADIKVIKEDSDSDKHDNEKPEAGGGIIPDKPDSENGNVPEKPDITDNEYTGFPDVPESHWAYNYIKNAFIKGIVSGSSDGMFYPDRYMNRAEFVTILWRMAGSPESEGSAGFADVSSSDWFAKQVKWASENNIVKGSDNKFNPYGNITREQAMTILFRYNGGISGMETMFYNIYDNSFSDSKSIKSWARSSVYWAVYNNIVKGVTANTIVPEGNASRAEISTIVLRYMEKFSK